MKQAQHRKEKQYAEIQEASTLHSSVNHRSSMPFIPRSLRGRIHSPRPPPLTADPGPGARGPDWGQIWGRTALSHVWESDRCRMFSPRGLGRRKAPGQKGQVLQAWGRPPALGGLGPSELSSGLVFVDLRWMPLSFGVAGFTSDPTIHPTSGQIPQKHWVAFLNFEVGI